MLLGAAILIKREAIDDVGGFDERFHMYGEDNEWCLRMVRAGWALIFEPEAVVVHHGGHGSNQRWLAQERLEAQDESYFLFCRTSLSRGHQLANLLTMNALSLLQLARRKLGGQTVGQEKLLLKLHRAELRRLLRGDHSSRSERNQASS